MTVKITYEAKEMEIALAEAFVDICDLLTESRLLPRVLHQKEGSNDAPACASSRRSA